MQYKWVWMIALFAVGLLAQPVFAHAELKMTQARALAEAPPMRFALLLPFAIGMLFAACTFSAETVGQMLLHIVMFGLCYLATVMDLKYRLIPNEIVVGLLVAGAVGNLLGVAPTGLLSACGGFGIIFLLFTLPYLFGRKVGGGDVKLAAAIGFCAGFRGALIVTVIMGLMILLYTTLSKGTIYETMKNMIPMAPFVTAAFLVFILL